MEIEGQKTEAEIVPATTQTADSPLLPFHLIKLSPTRDRLILVSGSNFSVLNLRDGKFLRFEGDDANQHSDLIRSAAWNSNGTILATAGDDKVVKLWVMHEDSTYHFNGQTQKNSKKLTSVVFGSGPDGDLIIYADKFGEVFSSPLSQPDAQPKVLLGHVSIITEVLLSPGGDFLLSADRDEKIRVSQYPKAYNIEAYCLGHTQFVSRLCIPASHPSLLFSGSGDGTVRVWRYVPAGELLHVEDLKKGDDDKRIVTLPVAFSDDKQLLAVLVEGVASVYLFKLVDGKELREAQVLSLHSAPCDAAFDKEDNLWVSTFDGVVAFASAADDHAYSPVGEGHGLSATLKTLNENREPRQAKAVLEKNVEKALAYGPMRKRTQADKEQAKKRRTEESANASSGGGSSKEKRKQRRNKGGKRGAAAASEKPQTAADEAKESETAVMKKEDKEEKTSA